LAEESERRPLRVNTVEPGPLRTSLQHDAFPAGDPEDRADPAEIAPAFVELVAPTGVAHRGQRLGPADLLAP
jgi:NAD(P)-dependent dehydrogenase (short-subunit alcohol dehydrogenase family)